MSVRAAEQGGKTRELSSFLSRSVSDKIPDQRRSLLYSSPVAARGLIFTRAMNSVVPVSTFCPKVSR